MVSLEPRVVVLIRVGIEQKFLAQKALVNVTFDGTNTHRSSKPSCERLVVILDGLGVERLSYVVRIISSLLEPDR